MLTSTPGMLDEPAAGGLIDDDRQQAVLQRIAAEDVGDLGADDRAEAVVEQAPTARVRARSRNRSCVRRPAPGSRAACGWLRTKSGRGAAVRADSASRRTAASPRPLARGRGQKARRNDLVGVDIGVRQHDRARADGADQAASAVSHDSISRGSVTRPRDRSRRSGQRGSPAACARPCPGGPRNCGCWC